MHKQKDLILKRDWDYLFILDACRYDYFERIYREYLNGELRKVESPGSMTREWAVKTFDDAKLEDVVYVSGNPWFNSQFSEADFNASEHFYDIIDVWDFGWDETNTVRPEAMEEGFKKAQIKYPQKRKIIHYMQPHAPYLDRLGSEAATVEKVMSFFSSLINKIRSSFSSEEEESVPFAKGVGKVNARRKIGDWLVQKFGHKFVSDLRKYIGLPPGPIWDMIMREGVEELHKYYEDNLRRALKSVSKLVNSLEGKIVVSADHGELLGEKFNVHGEDQRSIGQDFTVIEGRRIAYGHPAGSESETMRMVPWLEIQGR